ncbi:glycosyltransferase family 2 protein [Candidatus Falkowbacteria bacterium]|nr:glycosyltransferase family 2 protein [Candidatus Falkowbacteria bacterium]
MEQATDNKSSRLSCLFIAHILILLGYSANKGLFFHQSQLWFLFLGWLVLFLAFIKKDYLDFNFGLKPLNLLMLGTSVSFILFYFFDGGIYLVSRQAQNNITSLKFIALILFFFYLVSFNLKGKNFFSVVLMHLKRFKFIYLVVLALFLRLSIIFYSPAPIIDVFWVLKGGADSLIIGANPYSQEFVNVYSKSDCQTLYGTPDCKNDHYTYFPGILIATTFFRVLFGDPRVTYVFAIFGTAAIIYFLLRKRFRQIPEIPELTSLLILYMPLGLFVLEQSWADQILVFLLYLFVFLNVYNLSSWSYVGLGLFLSAKQTAWIFFPFIFKLKDFSWKKFILMIGSFVFITIPFFVWDYFSFIEDTVIHHLTYKVPLFSLTFNTLSKVYFFSDIPSVLPVLFAALLVVAYNAAATLVQVLERIPDEILDIIKEIFIIDDHSTDDTYLIGAKYKKMKGMDKLNVYRNHKNLGYGGNQKAGYNYAIKKGYDYIVLLHGDGQYAPEALPILLEPIVKNQAEIVFGSRMMERGRALEGGMPLYKYIGNKILTAYENFMLGMNLSEFHSGYRVYPCRHLARIPYNLNTDDFHFDSEIIIQFNELGLKILELPVPTYYGNEICYVNGVKYAKNIFKTVLDYKFNKKSPKYLIDK